MLYVANQAPSYDGQADKPSTSAASVVEDDVDQFLTKLDGKIYRERDDQLWVSLNSLLSALSKL